MELNPVGIVNDISKDVDIGRSSGSQEPGDWGFSHFGKRGEHVTKTSSLLVSKKTR